MSKRIFIAYKLPNELKNDMLFYQHKVKNIKNFYGVNWVKQENMHITIAFLGQVIDRDIEKVKSIIDSVHFSPVKIKTHKVAFFIKNGRPAILYMSVSNADELKDKAEEIRSKLVDKGINFDRKQFNAHITLARVKREADADDFYNAVMEKLDRVEEKEYTINNIVLYESKFIDRGPKYIQLYSKVRELYNE